jgi:5-methylcytosine-specific restriction protein A
LILNIPPHLTPHLPHSFYWGKLASAVFLWYFNCMGCKPQRECGRIGCRNLTTSRYCAEHTVAPRRSAHRGRDSRASCSDRGYDWRWHKLRNTVLSRRPMCERCYAAGRQGVPAKVVHHIDHNQRNNSMHNLQPLCRDCHERLHGRIGCKINWGDYDCAV